MGKFQAMHKYFVVFLALVAFHDCHQTHGRKIIKPLSTNIAGQKNNPHPILPPLKSSVNVPTPSSKKVGTPKTTPNYGVATSFEDSSSDTSALRPSTPGHSGGGVGHPKFAGEDNHMGAMVVVQSPDGEVEVPVTTGSKNDFNPTGHSPGVGHAYPNKNGQLN